jgi:hypothetical protein
MPNYDRTTTGDKMTPMSTNEAIPLPDGIIDKISILAGHLLRVTGWYRSEPPTFTLQVDGRGCVPSAIYRAYRPDVAPVLDSTDLYLGFVVEYLLPCDQPALELELSLGATSLYRATVATGRPDDYITLMATDRVKGRDDIYCIGPPSETASPEILHLALQLPDPILDFGCGGCGLMRGLLDAGRDVRGIELAGTLATQHIPADLRHLVTIYGGDLPMPFAARTFKSVIASEVIEHIPNYADVITDIARVAGEQALFTVPDNGVLPILAPTRLIPWHYLAADHHNFFTQQSLAATLRPYFRDIRFFRSGAVEVGGLATFVNLEALCEK